MVFLPVPVESKQYACLGHNIESIGSGNACQLHTLKSSLQYVVPEYLMPKVIDGQC